MWGPSRQAHPQGRGNAKVWNEGAYISSYGPK